MENILTALLAFYVGSVTSKNFCKFVLCTPENGYKAIASGGTFPEFLSVVQTNVDFSFGYHYAAEYILNAENANGLTIGSFDFEQCEKKSKNF